MWYKFAIQGRIFSRYPDFEEKLKKHIYKCRIKRKSGYHLDFFKLNALLPDEFKKYIYLKLSRNEFLAYGFLVSGIVSIIIVKYIFV